MNMTRPFALALTAAITMSASFEASLADMAPSEPSPFHDLFDGETLTGWTAADMHFWSVEDGAITGRVTEDYPIPHHQYLIWDQGELDDFELRLKYRLSTSPGSNSGVQFRSQVREDGTMVGYQAEMVPGGGGVGILFDLGDRGGMAEQGQRVVYGPEGDKTVSDLPEAPALPGMFSDDEWVDYHIIARGPAITLRINGQTICEVVDNDPQRQDLSGKLGLQLHHGPPMEVQFKDIQLRRLPLAEDRKKLVMVAGPRSHGYGMHEHRAGFLLAADALAVAAPHIQTTLYADGWPADPSAFDNADAVAINCDGLGSHVLRGHYETFDRLMQRGVSAVFLHYAVLPPEGDETAYAHWLDWIGGYYETHWSVYPHWTPHFEEFPDHPVTRGMGPFQISDEWYFHMRFREGMEGVTPLLSAVPPEEARSGADGPHSGNPHVRARQGMAEVVAWAVERPDGGRGLGFTGGHWHWNWAHPEYRRFLLNALVWAATGDVPEGGVQSATPTLEQLLANQDYERPEDFDVERIARMVEGWQE